MNVICSINFADLLGRMSFRVLPCMLVSPQKYHPGYHKTVYFRILSTYMRVLPHYIDRLAMTCYMRYETVKRLHKIMHLFMNVTIQHKQIRYTYE